jgi:hypothetical protein
MEGEIMPNVADDREIHQINFPKLVFADLCNFRKAYNYADNGLGVQALLENYRQVLDLRKKYEDKLQQFEVKKQEIQDYEQQLIQESGLSQAAFAMIQQVIEDDGVDPQELEAACQLLRVSGVSLSDLVQSLAKIGGMKNYMVTLNQAVEQLESEQQGIADRKMKQCADTTKARIEMERLQLEQQKARQEIEGALEFARVVTKGYESLNIVLGNIIGKVLQGGYSMMDLPEMGMRVLAGVIMMLCVEMHGDKELVLPQNVVLQRLAKVKVDLSEIPKSLAPAEMYAEFTARMSLLDGSNGESHMEDDQTFAQSQGV